MIKYSNSVKVIAKIDKKEEKKRNGKGVLYKEKIR